VRFKHDESGFFFFSLCIDRFLAVGSYGKVEVEPGGICSGQMASFYWPKLLSLGPQQQPQFRTDGKYGV
jgi:hypothetical protein